MSRSITFSPSVTNLYQIRYRAALSHPPSQLVVQGIWHEGREMLWIDGLDMVDPILVDKSVPTQVECVGNYQELVSNNAYSYLSIVALNPENSYSPTIMTRAILIMAVRPHMNPLQVLEAVLRDAASLRELDRQDRGVFEACLRLAA